jgi:hypothetical protein
MNSHDTDSIRWPHHWDDPGRQAAVEVLLLMADADARWGEYRDAVSLLESVEEIVGELPAEYEVKRRRWTRLEVITGEPRLAAVG